MPIVGHVPSNQNEVGRGELDDMIAYEPCGRSASKERDFRLGMVVPVMAFASGANGRSRGGNDLDLCVARSPANQPETFARRQQNSLDNCVHRK
jgi:hypothetical protein